MKEKNIEESFDRFEHFDKCFKKMQMQALFC